MGTIEGGWDFVVAAYAVVWGGLLLYGSSLYWRRRRADLEIPKEKQ